MIDEEIQARQFIIGSYDGTTDFYRNCTEIEPVKKEIKSSEEIESELKDLIDVEVTL